MRTRAASTTGLITPLTSPVQPNLFFLLICRTKNLFILSKIFPVHERSASQTSFPNPASGMLPVLEAEADLSVSVNSQILSFCKNIFRWVKHYL